MTDVARNPTGTLEFGPMPLLEYRCDSCGARVEDLVLAGDAPRAPACPECGSATLSRLLSTFAARANAGSAGAAAGFDAATACGGGACRMPDVCGAGSLDD